MKKFLSFSLLAIMLSAHVAPPVFAQESNKFEQSSDNKAAAFAAGLITGAIPVAGTAFSVLMLGIGQGNVNIGEAVSFAAGHALGISVWALPWYLVYRQYTSNK
jgi:zinc transporter ZupT